MAKKRVKAAEGLKVYFPLAVKAAPGARTFVLEGDSEIEIDVDNAFVARRIRKGDLVIVKPPRTTRATSTTSAPAGAAKPQAEG